MQWALEETLQNVQQVREVAVLRTGGVLMGIITFPPTRNTRLHNLPAKGLFEIADVQELTYA